MTPHSLFSENRRLLSTKSSSISPWNTATAAVFSFIKWWLNNSIFVDSLNNFLANDTPPPGSFTSFSPKPWQMILLLTSLKKREKKRFYLSSIPSSTLHSNSTFLSLCPHPLCGVGRTLSPSPGPTYPPAKVLGPRLFLSVFTAWLESLLFLHPMAPSPQLQTRNGNLYFKGKTPP